MGDAVPSEIAASSDPSGDAAHVVEFTLGEETCAVDVDRLIAAVTGNQD